MRTQGKAGLLLLLILLLPACTGSRLTGSWVDPEFRRADIRSLLVVGVSGEDLLRRTFEDEMVARLRQYGLQAAPSYRTISGKELGKDEMEAWIGEQKVDGVIVSQLVGTRRETVVQPGYSTRFGAHYGPYWDRGRRYPWVDPYHGWYGYYSGSYDVLHYPPEVSTYEVYVIETTLYKVDADQPVWSARAEISSETDVNDAIEDLVTDLIDNMVDHGVL